VEKLEVQSAQILPLIRELHEAFLRRTPIKREIGTASMSPAVAPLARPQSSQKQLSLLEPNLDKNVELQLEGIVGAFYTGLVIKAFGFSSSLVRLALTESHLHSIRPILPQYSPFTIQSDVFQVSKSKWLTRKLDKYIEERTAGVLKFTSWMGTEDMLITN
jgi:hypothetical protein